MAIYELKPITLQSPHWEGSTWKGRVIVRAPDESEARLAAAKAFTVARRRHPGQDSPHCPWTDNTLVSCVQLHDSEYDEDGPTEVLYPDDVD